MNGKKKCSKILLIFGVLIGVVGVSYALWRASFSSTNDNSLTATCFNVSFTDQNNISIEKAYPLLDKDGKKLTPYEFTITNNCDSYVKYDINLEVLNTSTLTNMNYIKLMLDDGTPALVSSYNVTTKTLSNASSAYKISTGYLDAKESKTYNLRLWLDENVTGETEGVQNNTFTSKISVNASYVDKIAPDVTKYITTLATTDTKNLATDDYGNVRYIGHNPNNYISINGDMWRIIGVMKDIDDGNGIKSDLVKIIRADTIGGYSWDTSASSVNNGNGVNEWSESDLMKLLNPGYESESVGGSLYWNGGAGTCYTSDVLTTSSCDFSKKSINKQTKRLLIPIVWNTGAVSTAEKNVKEFYEGERSNQSSKICSSGSWCNDTVERKTTWKGLIGLIYPSDYGYATSGGSTTDRVTCLNTNLSNWEDSNVSDCKNNDWLSVYTWTITPQIDLGPNISTAYFAFSIQAASFNTQGESIGGDVTSFRASIDNSVRPSAYLKSSVKIASGSGSQDDPFILEN